MPQNLKQRRYLVKDSSSLKKWLVNNAQVLEESYKYKDKSSTVYDFQTWVCVLEEYKKSLKGLSVLVFISAQDIAIPPKIVKLPEITEDIRYSKEYLERFGYPAQYDFSLPNVLQKCDSVGRAHMDLHFLPGMSKTKVFRVLLYRLNQIFSLYHQDFLNNELDYDYLQNAHKQLKHILLLAQGVFCKKAVKSLLRDLDDLYMLLNHEDKIDRYFLNFSLFIQEESHFYEAKNAHEPIYFFIKRRIHKLLQDQREKAKGFTYKTLLNREFITQMEEIETLMRFFVSILDEGEKRDFDSEILSLKRINMRRH